ncbi:hypothetical protein DFP72DRAFT_910849 [Ephemerocybe angulata]|uniref:Uncharacterized protein n=1 Tax=Ephemerocybe angulata TaxID=980116 RepID=A0A8H6M3M8_9AGAR|nr:hypothetical protein DFP72DRAFT_910849 [Tulosesus angulatus]
MRFSTAAVAIAAATLGGSVVSAIPVPNQETALAQLEARETALLIDSILEARGYMDGEVDVSKRGVRTWIQGKLQKAVGVPGSQSADPNAAVARSLDGEVDVSKRGVRTWIQGKLQKAVGVTGSQSADPNAAVARSLDADLVERDEEVSAPAPRPKHHGQGNGNRKGNRKNRKHRKTQNGEHNRKNRKNGNRKNSKHAKEAADPTAPTATGGAGANTDAPSAAHAKSSSTSPAPVPDASTTTLTARELEEFIEILRRAGEDAPETGRRPQRHNHKQGAEARRRARQSRADGGAQHES